MPLPRKEYHEATFADLLLGSGVGSEQPASFGDVHQLVFTQDASFLGIEVVTGRMVAQGIGRIGLDGLKADSVYPQTEPLVHIIHDQILEFNS